MTITVSALELFSIGIGPSSSHTVGPMRAARTFVDELRASGLLDRVTAVSVELGGSLGSTGVGHGTPAAVVAGLEGHRPEQCDPVAVRARWEELSARDGRLQLDRGPVIDFGRGVVALYPLRRHPRHPNALTVVARLDDQTEFRATYLSVGGGFIVREGAPEPDRPAVPYPFRSGYELLAICEAEGLTIAEVVRANELAFHDPSALDAGLDAIWDAMSECIDAGLAATGILPGGLNVPRRASAVRAILDSRPYPGDDEWLDAYALAVNEENAAGARVVTAPTNGAAGILPAVIRDHLRRDGGAGRETIREMLLTATAIGSLAKGNASISGAEVGCQGEVGSACAMAAAALTAARGGSPAQIENAAEIAIEHHLGLTCDPVAGLVQIPCIERNAVAASTARTATRLALLGDGLHRVSFDTALETMRQTGADMKDEYKETSAAGLAVNVVEC
jgi:L-serine dehydratase